MAGRRLQNSNNEARRLRVKHWYVTHVGHPLLQRRGHLRGGRGAVTYVEIRKCGHGSMSRVRSEGPRKMGPRDRISKVKHSCGNSVKADSTRHAIVVAVIICLPMFCTGDASASAVVASGELLRVRATAVAADGVSGSSHTIVAITASWSTAPSTGWEHGNAKYRLEILSVSGIGLV